MMFFKNLWINMTCPNFFRESDKASEKGVLQSSIAKGYLGIGWAW